MSGGMDDGRRTPWVGCDSRMAQQVRLARHHVQGCFSKGPSRCLASRGNKAVICVMGCAGSSNYALHGARGALQAPAWVLRFVGEGGRAFVASRLEGREL